MFVRIHFDFRLRAERANQNALHFTLVGLLRCQNAATNLFGDERMIPGELVERTGAQQVRAAVAHMSHTDAVLLYPGGNYRCSHSPLRRVGSGSFMNLAIGKAYSACQAVGSFRKRCVAFAEKGSRRVMYGFQAMACYRLNGKSAGHFSVRFASHPVGK